jgi:hypothetical protein
MLTIMGLLHLSSARTTKKLKKAVAAKAAKVNRLEWYSPSETIDYGTIAHNADGQRQFVFTNNGTNH